MSGKKYIEASKLFSREQLYSLPEAIKLVKAMSSLEKAKRKFDETVEMHFRLGIDPRHSDQQVRSTVLLPHGLGRTVRVLVFAEGEDAKLAEQSGADIVGGEEIINQIQKDGWLEFDAALAVPSMMSKVGRVARILGPRGLMPNLKAGTVANPDQIARAIQEVKAGRVEFRNDKTGNLHFPVGKVSFDEEKLIDNAQVAVSAVLAQKPTAVKGEYVRRVVVTATMSPGVRVTLK